MVARISVKNDIDEVMRKLAAQMPERIEVAARVAIRRTADLTKVAEEDEIRRVFDRPTPYTQKAVKVRTWRTKLEAQVWLKDEGDAGKGTAATKYLGPQIDGGERGAKRFERSLQRVGLLPAGWLAVPGEGARMDAYGNMASAQLVQILAWFRAFGEQGYRANMTDKRRARLRKGTKKKLGIAYFAVLPGRRNRHLHPGIYQRTDFAIGSAIKPVLIFIDRAQYQRRFAFYQVAQRAVDRHFKPEVDKAVQHELDRVRT